MFPLVNQDKGNPLRFFQIWLNLPARKKLTEPAFKMHWAEEVPKVTSPDGLATVTVWAGEFGGVKALPPCPDSWAADPHNDVTVMHVAAKAGAQLELPAAKKGCNRTIYFFAGENLSVLGEKLGQHCMAEVVNAEQPITLATASVDCELLVLGGRPIAEPVAQRGPFVMNTSDELMQAFVDFRATNFGVWRWPSEDHVHMGKSRFALIDGKEYYPPPPSK